MAQQLGARPLLSTVQHVHIMLFVGSVVCRFEGRPGAPSAVLLLAQHWAPGRPWELLPGCCVVYSTLVALEK
jgi:hypothetical protein